jgi:uncharacterized protein GlcG (DUF336 family)
MMTLHDANRLIALSFEKARELSLKPLAVAIFDEGGHLVAAQRQDGASLGRLAIASGKANGALFMGMSSRSVSDMAMQRPAFAASLGTVAPAGIIAAPGGLLVSDQQGRLIGAIGISGDTSDNDEACATAAIEEASLLVCRY